MHTGKPGGSLQKVTVRFRKVLKKQKKHYIDCIANGRIDMKSNRKADCQKKAQVIGNKDTICPFTLLICKVYRNVSRLAVAKISMLSNMEFQEKI
jgi:hypothetical protein